MEKISQIIIMLKKPLLIAVAVFAPASLYADINNGSTDYSQSMQALEEVTKYSLAMMGSVVLILYAIGSLAAIYNAMVIYIKLNTGEPGFLKSLLMLLGAVCFLIGVTIVFPAFFGINDFRST